MANRGYAVGVCALACFLFFMLWWLLHDESGESNSSALTAAIAAVFVILISFLARDRVLNRRTARHRTRQRYDTETAFTRIDRRRTPGATRQRMAALSVLERKLAEVNAKANTPEQYLRAYRICEEYVANLKDTLNSGGLAHHTRQGLRARQARVQAMQKQHLLSWARESSQKLIHQAQSRARVSAKIEMALQASAVIESALRIYPGERQLHDSMAAIHDYMAFARAEHWMELAERAAFKGHPQKAIDRYQNALFYIHRDKVWNQSRAEIEERIQRRVYSLQTGLSSGKKADDSSLREPAPLT